MAELNKGTLTAENNNSFPNNNTGFITPTLLRTFNGNMIDSLVDEVTYNIDSASFSSSISQLKNFSSSLDNTYATDAQLSASASTLQNNINSLSASVTVTVNSLSSSIAVTDLAQSSSIAALQVFSSSLDATFATDAQLSASASTLQNNINSLSQSVAVTDLAQSQSIAALQQFSSSLDNTFATDTQLSASASTLQNEINLKVNISQTSSMTVLSSSYAITASHATNVPATASFAISASQAATASYLLGSIESASFAQTASFLLGSIASASYALFAETSSITQQVSTSISTQNLQHNVLFIDTTGPGFVQVDGGLRYNPNTNLLTTTASLALTASFAENVPTNIATTGSNTFIGNQIISGNLLVTGSNINLEVDSPALSVGVTNVKTVLDATASGVVSSTDIYRQGAGPTGDLSGIRLQTLSGSDTTGDTLLSRIQTGVNRHTSTGMTGSVVNTTITSTWATGSGGTRVAYGTSINANAQSQSATLTLIAGNSSLNNVGGTASIAAGLIRIGTNVAHTISSTGSFGPITIVGPNNGNALMIRSGSVEITSPQGSGSFYTNLPITSSNGRINGYLITKNLIVSGTEAGSPANTSGSVWVEGNTTTNTLNVIGSASFSGSVYGEVRNATVTANTASVDLTLDNFWQLQLTGSTTTFINIQPVRPGQTINIKVNTTGSGNVEFPSYVKQPSGSAYIATPNTGVDILTLISFDSSNIYLASIKNFI